MSMNIVGNKVKYCDVMEYLFNKKINYSFDIESDDDGYVTIEDVIKKITEPNNKYFRFINLENKLKNKKPAEVKYSKNTYNLILAISSARDAMATHFKRINTDYFYTDSFGKQMNDLKMKLDVLMSIYTDGREMVLMQDVNSVSEINKYGHTVLSDMYFKNKEYGFFISNKCKKELSLKLDDIYKLHKKRIGDTYIEFNSYVDELGIDFCEFFKTLFYSMYYIQENIVKLDTITSKIFVDDILPSWIDVRDEFVETIFYIYKKKYMV